MYNNGGEERESEREREATVLEAARNSSLHRPIYAFNAFANEPAKVAIIIKAFSLHMT